jgi:nicotinamide-nucleotide amidase
MSGTARLISADLAAIAKRVLALAGERGSGIVTAESCTSGLLASALSEAPGAAQLLHGGFVTYTKANKTAALGIPGDLLSGPRGAVSPEVATAMAEGALARSPADLAIAITGVAGPAPDEDGNPVGLVCIAVARKSFPPTVLEHNYGDIGRDAVRERAMIDALREVERLLVRAGDD